MSNKTLQIKKSIIDPEPLSLLFGELSVSDVSNNVKVFIGDSSSNPVKIFDEANPSEVIYNNNKNKFVSPAGLNTNNGQAGRPYQTITYGLSQIVSGGVLSLEAGSFAETVAMTTSDSTKSILGTDCSKIRAGTEFNGQFNITGDKITISNIEFTSSSVTKHINITSSSATGNYSFQNLTVSGTTSSLSSIIYIENVLGSAGFVNIDSCDLNNRKVTLENSTIPRLCFITNSRNIQLDAGTNWIVYIDESAIQEISNNENIYTSQNSVIDIISSTPSSSGIYLLSANLTIGSVTYSKGSLIQWNGVNVTFSQKYYLNAPVYYIVNLKKVYAKVGSSVYEEVTTYPIIL